MISAITFEHGKTTCAVEPGCFCRWLGASGFGTKPVCMLFGNQPLYENKDGWIERCSQCVIDFGEQT